MTLDLNKLSATTLVELQHGAALELVARQKDLVEGYVQSRNTTQKVQKEAEELHQVRMQLTEEKLREINQLKVT